jgi:Adipocyte plasma membrane-associated protein-like, N-terminal
MPARGITVVPLPGNGPEDVVVDKAGQLWTGLEDGRIVRIPPDGGEPTVIADTGGQPLGLHIARDGRVLICDSHRGLLALDSTSGSLDVLVESVAGRRLKFCSNVTETPDRLQPQIKSEVWAAAFDLDSGAARAPSIRTSAPSPVLSRRPARSVSQPSLMWTWKPRSGKSPRRRIHFNGQREFDTIESILRA